MLWIEVMGYYKLEGMRCYELKEWEYYKLESMEYYELKELDIINWTERNITVSEFSLMLVLDSSLFLLPVSFLQTLLRAVFAHKQVKDWEKSIIHCPRST